MTFTENDLIPLKKALISGTTSVSIGNRTVSFRNLNELKRLISDIEAKINADENPETELVPNKVVAKWSKI